MRRSLFDLLDEELDCAAEYNKLFDMLYEATMKLGGYQCSYVNLFDNFIKDWKYRGTFINAREIIDSINSKINPISNPEEAILYLCEFVLNIREFFIYKQTRISEGMIFKDKIFHDNVMTILDKLGYESFKEEEYKIKICVKNSDAATTAQIVEDINLAKLVLSYNDFRIRNNANDKRDILLKIIKFFEADRPKIKSINKSLETNIGAAINNLNLRHNNISGKDKVEFTSKLSQEQFVDFYDKVYYMLLMAFRLIELPEVNKEFDELREKKFTN